MIRGAGVEVGGGVEAVLLAVVFEDADEAPDEGAGGSPDGESEDDPAVEAHDDFFSRAFQVRTARAMSSRKRTVTARTKRRAMRTEGEVWMACQFEAQDWWSQRAKTVSRKSGEM